MKISRPFHLGATLCALIAVTGCSANHYTVFRKIDLGNSSRVVSGSPDPSGNSSKSLVSIDAKQRTVVFNGKRSCAEPSPDVFAVIAQSLSTGGTFSKSANPASLAAAFNVAFGSAEQGSTIPRTQTVNMLRELMYRT